MPHRLRWARPADRSLGHKIRSRAPSIIAVLMGTTEFLNGPQDRTKSRAPMLRVITDFL